MSGGDLGWPLRRAARLYRDSVAVIDGSRTLTYAELAERVAALASVLDELSLEAGDRVGFLGVNSLAHLECWLGVPAAGRVLVDLNFRLSEDELAFIVDDCELAVLIVDRHQLEIGRALRSRCPSLEALIADVSGAPPQECFAYEELVSGRPGVPALAPSQPELAAICYTGGTTGAPKGVMLSHENLLANARHNLIATGHQPSDRWLHVCPMFHVAGTANVFACTWTGARQVILPRFDGGAVLGTIEREAITHTVLVPTMLATLLEQLDAGPERRLESLRHIQYAASPIVPALQRRVLERFDCDVVQFYGMTEAAPTVSCASAEDHRLGFAGEPGYVKRLRSVGAPVVGVQADVRGLAGEALSAGEVGEIWVRGPNVMLGYWKRPQETQTALVDDWYRTGDAAYMAEDGYLYLVDRLKDMIISGGENVYSVEVELALAEHEAVREAAVFGVPDPHWGEAVYAVVVVDDGSDVRAEELIAHVRRRIAGYKIPRKIEVRQEPLPKSGAGKVRKNLLKEAFWTGQEQRVR
ncbi:MAG: long-chain-fatty-acid--CoA ligase [Solirubrobacterales bacterium]|nr:long-chain-fatty-acid--CoA ligase [Solirubrobacterales bacterium]